MEEGQSTLLKNLMFTYQHKMKEARNSYFSEVFKNCGPNPKIIFKTVKIFNKSLPTQPIEPCPEKSGQFFGYFTKTIEETCLEFNTDFREPDI